MIAVLAANVQSVNCNDMAYIASYSRTDSEDVCTKVYKSKSEHILSDVNDETVQKCQQKFFVRGHRLRSNMGLQFFHMMMALELVKGISN